MTKQPRDKIITYWSGRRFRYRKDGKPDMRYNIGRKMAKAQRVIGKSVYKQPIKQSRKVIRPPLRSPQIGPRAFVHLCVYVAIITAWVFIIKNPPGSYTGEIISPLVSYGQEVESVTVTIEDIIGQYDWPVDTMTAIAKSENGYEYNRAWNTDAEFRGNSNSTVDRGVFMINSGTFADFMVRHPAQLDALGIVDYDDMFDANKNIALAYLIWQEQGLGAWTCYRNGNYLVFVGRV